MIFQQQRFPIEGGLRLTRTSRYSFFEAFEGKSELRVEFEASSGNVKSRVGAVTGCPFSFSCTAKGFMHYSLFLLDPLVPISWVEMVTLSLTLAGVKVHVQTYDVLDFDLDFEMD
nr:hypothetical protein Iba_chr06cCG10340 [Ipomoea batatas]